MRRPTAMHISFKQHIPQPQGQEELHFLCKNGVTKYCACALKIIKTTQHHHNNNNNVMKYTNTISLYNDLNSVLMFVFLCLILFMVFQFHLFSVILILKPPRSVLGLFLLQLLAEQLLRTPFNQQCILHHPLHAGIIGPNQMASGTSSTSFSFPQNTTLQKIFFYSQFIFSYVKFFFL